MEVQTTAVAMRVPATLRASKHNCELVACADIVPENAASVSPAHEMNDGVVLADNMRQAPRSRH